MNQYCLGFAFDNVDGSTVLLINKSKPAWQKGKLNGLGGSIEPGEHADDAMVREFKEECGITTTPLDWHKFCIMRGVDWVVHCYKAKLGIYEYESLTNESVEIIPLNYLDERELISNIKWLLKMCEDEDALRNPLIVDYWGV